MIKEILLLGSFFLAGFLFTYLRSKIIKKSVSVLKTNYPEQYNASIGKIYKAGKEVFEWKKCKNIFALTSSVEWMKSIKEIIDLRKLVIYGIIITVLCSYTYWKGQQGKPISVNLNYEESVEIQVPKSDLRLYKPKNSNQLYWIDKQGNKTSVKVADLPALQKALRPYGIIFKPYVIGGIGIGMKHTGMEGGIGTHFLKYYFWRLNASLTSRGVYLGIGYKLSGLKLDNTSLNLSYGKGWAGDDRVLVGITIEF